MMILRNKHPYSWWSMCVLALLVITLPAQAVAHAHDNAIGVLVVAPDRGWLGNEEVRDAFDDFAEERNAQLLFAVDARSKPALAARLKALRQAGARHVIVLPLVISSADPRWQRVAGWLKGQDVTLARPYGQSYLAVEDLAARLRGLHTDKKHLLVLGYGATDAASSRAMTADLARIAGFASSLRPAAIKAVVYPASRDAKALRAAAEDAVKKAHDTLVVPLAFAPRDDSMMDFVHWFSRDLPQDAQMADSPLATTDHLAQWMARATAQAALKLAPVKPAQVGVVVLAHGADWFWNHAIMDALAPVASRYKLAYAFSMADQPVVERAIDKLQDENVSAIVVVRAFSMHDSFLGSVNRMLGLDVEARPSHAAESRGGHGMMTGHGMHHASLAAAPRIRTDVPVVTVGGVDGDPLLAKALLENARSVSKHPADETVILVAHGLGDDAANSHWLHTLGQLADRMRADGGDAFRAIKVATWREDWPQKRDEDIARVRAMFGPAQQNHGRVLIVPARINGRGRADRYLRGLDFGWSQGFAQTPYFAQWFEQEIHRGVAALNAAH